MRKLSYIIRIQILQHIRYGLALFCLPLCQFLQLPFFHAIIKLSHCLSLFILLQREFSDQIILQIVQHICYGLPFLHPPLRHFPHCLIIQIWEKDFDIIAVFQEHTVGKLL